MSAVKAPCRQEMQAFQAWGHLQITVHNTSGLSCKTPPDTQALKLGSGERVLPVSMTLLGKPASSQLQTGTTGQQTYIASVVTFLATCHRRLATHCPCYCPLMRHRHSGHLTPQRTLPGRVSTEAPKFSEINPQTRQRETRTHAAHGQGGKRSAEQDTMAQ